MAQKPKTLTIAESNLLINHVYDLSKPWRRLLKPTRNYTMIVLMLDAGLRSGEVVQLKISDLFYNHEPKKSLLVRKLIAKRQRERLLPLTIRIRDAIKQMDRLWWKHGIDDEDHYAFYNSVKNKNLTKRQLQRIVKQASSEILGREIHPHVLRHTFASRLMRQVNSRIVQELLGHLNLSSTQIYTHPNNQDLTNAIERLES